MRLWPCFNCGAGCGFFTAAPTWQLERVRLATAFHLSVVLAVLAITQPRVVAATAQLVPGHVPAAVRSLQPLSHLNGSTRLKLCLGLQFRNKELLANLLQQLYDPKSPSYRKFLTPDQFAQRFGPTEEDYQSVIAYAQASGFTVTERHPNRALVEITASAADVEKAMGITLNVYQHPAEHRTFFAPASEPILALAVPIAHLGGLDNYARPRPMFVKQSFAGHLGAATPQTGSAPGGAYMGSDFRAAYAPGVSLTGAGQSVGLLEFDGFYPADITNYEAQANLSNVPINVTLLDGFNGTPGSANIEVALDIDTAMSMAPGISSIIVYEGEMTDTILNRMATDDLAKQLSASWTYQIDAFSDQLFLQFAAQGQSFFNASGDGDVWFDGVATPSDDPNITSVGGTTLTTSGPGGNWVSETVWNEGNGEGSGGGISARYAIPSWQQGVSMVANHGSTVRRNIPDVALTADNVYVIYDGGTSGPVGGTSCATPLWAGFMALANQQAAANGQLSIGFLNPTIYALGQTTNYPACLHDIVTGNNTNQYDPTNFFAVPGYDLCTGWGTPMGSNLIEQLAPAPDPLQITPAADFITGGALGGPFVLSSQTYMLTNRGGAGFSWSVGNPVTWLNVNQTNGTLSPGGPAAAVNITLTPAANTLAYGLHTATLVFTNSNDGVTQSREFSLIIAAAPNITLQPSNQSAGALTAVSFSVSATGGGLNLYYQWQHNGVKLSNSSRILGVTTDLLSITNISAADAGSYTVIVSNIVGSVTSAPAVLTFIPPPTVLAQPQVETVGMGDSAAFTVAATGTGPFTYQWLFDGTNVPSDLIETVAGDGVASFSGDEGAATNASLYHPVGVALDSAGNLFIADQWNNRIRKVNVAGIIATVAGNGSTSFSGDGGPATSASLDFPNPVTIAVDANGNLFIPDQGHNRVRKVNTNGIITTVAGNGGYTDSGDGGMATNAGVYYPDGVAVDSAGNLYIADIGQRVRKVATNGIITTVAGNGTNGFSGDGGPATNARCNNPKGLAVDSHFNLFISDSGNKRIRMVQTNGVITTAAGGGTAYNGDGGPATNATLSSPSGIAVDAAGNLYIADWNNCRIRQVNTNGIISTVAGNGSGSFAGDGGAPTNAGLFYPAAVAVDLSRNLFIADYDDERVRKVIPPGSASSPTLSLGNLALANAGQYSVVVTGLGGSVTSAPVLLNVGANLNASLAHGQLVLSWPGLYVLQSAIRVNGPYADVPNALNPYTNQIDSRTNRFFRLRSMASNSLTAPAFSANGFAFTAMGVGGYNFNIEASTDLIRWVPIQTNLLPIRFTDSEALEYPRRFYRLQLVH